MPQKIQLSGSDQYAGFSSGSLITSNEPQLEVASPFEITGGSATVTQINVDWYNSGDPNGGGQTVDYTIWRRTGLNPPVNGDQVSSGTLGGYYADAASDPAFPCKTMNCISIPA